MRKIFQIKKLVAQNAKRADLTLQDLRDALVVPAYCMTPSLRFWYRASRLDVTERSVL